MFPEVQPARRFDVFLRGRDDLLGIEYGGLPAFDLPRVGGLIGVIIDEGELGCLGLLQPNVVYYARLSRSRGVGDCSAGIQRVTDHAGMHRAVELLAARKRHSRAGRRAGPRVPIVQNRIPVADHQADADQHGDKPQADFDRLDGKPQVFAKR